MPPPKSLDSSRPYDLRVSEVKVHPDWTKPSDGRHHIFLFDGTWNDSTGLNPANFTWDNTRHRWVSRADPSQAFAPIVTNVVKTHHCLAPDSARQITHYFRGVGNDDENDTPNRLVEGAFSREEWGIRQLAYLEFLRHYRDGDLISILGFSRGAASARLFARDLAKWGLMDKLMLESRYATVRNTGDLRQEIWQTWPRKGKNLVRGSDVPIAFLGVWDTVATFVSADDADWNVPANVSRTVHCVALDETRDLYRPTVLAYEAKRAAAMKEVWFAGVHSDIGGGYFTDGLGRLTLDFMWDNWNSALERDGLQPLGWRSALVTAATDLTGITFARHSQVKPERKFLVSPRECRSSAGGRPRLHRSVDRFMQEGGLMFCQEKDGTFPPRCEMTHEPYQPLAHPGTDAVELYDSTAWA